MNITPSAKSRLHPANRTPAKDTPRGIITAKAAGTRPRSTAITLTTSSPHTSTINTATTATTTGRRVRER